MTYTQEKAAVLECIALEQKIEAAEKSIVEAKRNIEYYQNIKIKNFEMEIKKYELVIENSINELQKQIFLNGEKVFNSKFVK